MKEKNKSILKKVGVGALACLGVFTFAGCSSVEVSEDQIDTVMETVEQSNKYMQDQIDLLKKQNEQLQNQNNILTEQNQILEDANNKLTKQDAVDIINLTKFKYLFNQDGVLNNLKMSSVDENSRLCEEKYYVTSDGVRLCYNYTEAGDGNYHTLAYEVDDIKTAICEWIYDGSVNKEIKSHENGFFSSILSVSIIDYMCLTYMNNIIAENIIKISINQQGNYEIIYSISDEGATKILNYEIDKGCKIIKAKMSRYSYNEETNAGYIIVSSENNFEYGVITDEDIAEVLQKAQAADPQS